MSTWHRRHRPAPVVRPPQFGCFRPKPSTAETGDTAPLICRVQSRQCGETSSPSPSTTNFTLSADTSTLTNASERAYIRGTKMPASALLAVARLATFPSRYPSEKVASKIMYRFIPKKWNPPDPSKEHHANRYKVHISLMQVVIMMNVVASLLICRENWNGLGDI